MSELEKELAKAGGQLVVETAKDARKALATVFGEAANELAKIMGDSVRLWRFKNLLRISDEVTKLAAQRGIAREQLRALPIGDAIRVIEAASFEDEPEIQQLWAQLLANATDPSSPVKLERVFIDLLGSMSPPEVCLLDLLYNIKKLNSLDRDQHKHFEKWVRDVVQHRWMEYYKGPGMIAEVSAQNLMRKRCIAYDPGHGFSSSFSSFPKWDGRIDKLLTDEQFGKLVRDFVEYVAMSFGEKEPRSGYGAWAGRADFLEDIYTLTPLGLALMRACDPEQSAEVITRVQP